MFEKKIAISKNYLIAIGCILVLLFAANISMDDVHAVDVSQSDDAGYGISAIDEDKLENSQENDLIEASVQLNGGTFQTIQNAIHNSNDGDTLILSGEFTAPAEESHIVVYKNITITSSSKATLNGKNISSIFIVESGGSGSSFSNLVFKNGNGDYGGAMMIYGKDVKVSNCEFYDNYALSGGGAIYTDYNIDENSDHGRNLLIENCKFKNNFARIAAGAIGAYGYNTRILNCVFESNTVYNKNGGIVYGGAMQVGKEEFTSKALIKNCKFIGNKAISAPGSVSHGGASCIREGVTYENCVFEKNSADHGGALTAHCSGTLKNCTFKSNTANNYGGAVSNGNNENSMNLKIIDCNFDSNSAPYGGAARLSGYSITIEDCRFNNNYASIDGGAVYIKTKTLNIYDSNFTKNSAKHNGGAVYVNGEATTVQGSYFKSNVAIADPKVKDDGLGGALYINGTSDKVRNNVFEFNVARNGSAVYYDRQGKDLTMTNNQMTKNQAWVYLLPIYAHDIYYGESENIGAIIYGGNNIADYDNLLVSNAIYNAALNRYIVVNGETPVSGATNSGELYQDSREYNVDVLLTVKHSDGTVVYNRTLKSSYLGEVSAVLSNLKPGTYTVTAKHYEDNYYKAITNSTTFVVKPKVDVAVKKESGNSVYNYHDTVIWTLTVVNNGPNNATCVNVSDALPAGLIYQSCTPSVGSYSNGVWTIGNLAIGKSATLKITTLVNKTGDITNKATVAASEQDWNTTNNAASKKITVNAASDLAITKKANVTSPNYGDLVKWTLTVTNNGPDTAHGVNVSDVLPAGLVLKSQSGNYNSGKWTIGTLNVGQSKTLEIVTLVNKTGTIKNTAKVTGKEYDYNQANNEASSSINVAKSSDLQVSKSVNNTAPNYSKSVKWTVTVKNNGPDDATGVKVSDALPAGLVYQSYTTSLGSYSNGVWSVGNLAKGSSATLNIICLVNKTGNIKNTATVSGNEFDSNKNNNKADSSINVAKATDLRITKSVNNSTPNYGSLVKWTVNIRNYGPDDATGVKVSDILPKGLVLKSYDASLGSYSNGVWNVGNLAKGAGASIDIICLVNATGSFKNVANVTGNEYDYDLTNNGAFRSINVPKATDLRITKSVNNSTPNYGDLVKWTVNVRNYGPDGATGVKVNDLLPKGLVLKSYNATKGVYSNGVWSIGVLDKGAGASIDIICIVNKTGSVKNVVNVTGNEYDHDLSNNDAFRSVNVAKATDLRITKSVNNSAPNYGDLVKWTVSVRNYGPDDATGVKVNDILPSGLVLKSYNGTKGVYSNGVWSIGVLDKGAGATIDIICIVNKTGSIKNVVNVTGNEYDYDLTNNGAFRSINVPKAIDLRITKSVNNSAPNYGDLVKWTVSVRNYGPDDATGVKVNDILPSGLVLKSYNGTKGVYSNGVWSIGVLDKGAGATIDIICIVNKTGSIKNVVNVTGNEYDYDLSNNDAFRSVNVAKATDLRITKSVNNSAPNYGDLVKWTVSVRNYGPDDATAVKVNDILPKGLVLKSYNGTKGVYSNGVWSIGVLAKGAGATIDIICLVNDTGSFKNVVNVTGNEYDYDLTNNNAFRSINVPKAADLMVTKRVNVSAPNYGELVKWTINVRNYGPDDATGVKVNDILPAGLVLKSSNASVGRYSNGVWNIGALAKGTGASLEIVCLVNKTGSFKNVVNVTGKEFDYNLDNNNAFRSINVAKATDLRITKSVNNSTPNYGDSVKWTISVRNYGPDGATGVKVSDILPSGLVLKSYNATKGVYSNGVWSIGVLDKGAGATIDIVCIVNKTGSIKNIVNVTGNEYDYNLTNNDAFRSINVPKAADLRITKSVNNSAPNYASLVKWTVNVRNYGPDDATGVKVNDILPQGLVLESYNASVGRYSNGVWNIGALAKGSAASLEIVCLVNATGSFKNVVNVTAKEFDYNLTNNNAFRSINVAKSSDLQVNKRVNVSAPNYGDLVKWTVTVRNNGPDNATGVKVNDILPEGLILKSYNATKGVYSAGVWSVGVLAKGSSAAIDIICLVNRTGYVKNVVNVTGNEFDHNLSNNNASKSVKVPKAADLRITKSVNDSAPNYGSLVKWTVNVRNYGPDDATGVNVSDVLPEGLILKSFNATKGVYSNGVWSIGNLSKGAGARIDIVCQVNKTGSVKNVVNITGNEYDYNMTNNNAFRSINVPKAADLSVSKAVNNTAPNYGDLIKWTITVKNNGPDNATGIVLRDVLPEGLVHVSYASAKGNYSNGVWNISRLASDASVRLNIICKVNRTGTIKNVACVSANEYDINMTNNNASKSIKVPKAADLSVSKAVNNTAPNYGDLIKWTITVRNNGPDTAHDIVLSEILPKGLVVINASGNYNEGKWTVESLDAAKSLRFEIVTLVNKTGSIVNRVSVTGKEYDINMTNNNASKTVKVPKAADLEVTKHVNNTAPNYGDLITWTLTVKNNGPDDATGVVLCDILPDGVILVSSADYSDGIWNIGNLSKGASLSRDIVCKVNKTGTVVNIANVTGNEYDIDKTNNAANQSITVPPAADLEIIKTVNDSAAKYHDYVTWTLIVTNNGPDAAHDVAVEDIMPDGLVIESAGRNYSDGKWNIGTLDAFSSVKLEIVTFINKTGSLVNNASVSGREYDYDLSNNNGSSSLNVSKAADLEISKIVSNPNPNYLDKVKWIIIVKNNGPDTASNVKVAELLSDAFELINSTANKGNYAEGIWSVGSLDVDEKAILEILVKVVRTGNFTNAVNVTGDEYDHNASNNQANKSVIVNPSADLEITKDVNNTSPNYNDLVKWTVSITNNGPDKANGIQIMDLLSENLEMIIYNSTKGFYDDGMWKFCCLEVGEVVYLEIITRVLEIGETENIATAECDEYDYNPENNRDTASIDVAPACDLEITKSVNQSRIDYKKSVEWTLIVKNNGPSDATGVEVTDLLPDGLTYVCSEGDGDYTSNGTWFVGNIASGQSRELRIISRADKTGSFDNVATVIGNEYDYDDSNNKAIESLTVNPAADLSITKTVSKAESYVDDIITYTIEITNNGPDAAENIRVNEVMDKSLILKSFSLASGDYDAESNVWTIKSLANGEKTSLYINAVATKEGLVHNKVSVLADTLDDDLSNNYAEAIVEIIKKILDPENPYNPELYHDLKGFEKVSDNLNIVAKAGIQMKETGIPIGLLMIFSLISIAISGSKISKKR